MGGRAQQARARRARAQAGREWQRRREGRIAAVLLAVALVAMLGTAYPAYRYVNAESVYAELVGCERSSGKNVRCTARWTLGDGRRCQASVLADTRRWREPRRDYVRVEGCGVRGPLGLAVFGAMSVCLAAGGLTWAVRRRRGSSSA